MKRIHVIDDDEAVRDALSYLLSGEGLDVMGYDCAESYLAAGSPRDGVLVLDVRMSGMSGIELFHELLKEPPVPPVIFLTGHGDVPLAVEAMKSGAFDFQEKPFDNRTFVESVHRGLSAWKLQFTQIQDQESRSARIKTLTQRESEVMELMAAGKANKQIAFELGITVRTVEVHRAAVLRKLGCRTLVEMLRGYAQMTKAKGLS